MIEGFINSPYDLDTAKPILTRDSVDKKLTDANWRNITYLGRETDNFDLLVKDNKATQWK